MRLSQIKYDCNIPRVWRFHSITLGNGDVIAATSRPGTLMATATPPLTVPEPSLVKASIVCTLYSTEEGTAQVIVDIINETTSALVAGFGQVLSVEDGYANVAGFYVFSQLPAAGATTYAIRASKIAGGVACTCEQPIIEIDVCKA